MPSYAGRSHKRWVLLQRLSKPVADFDTSPAVWETVYTTRASIVPADQVEQTQGAKQVTHYTHAVRMRWLPEIAAGWRVVIEDGSQTSDDAKRILHVEAVSNWREKSKYITARCVEHG